MDCLNDIVWDFVDEEDGISDEFCASNGGAGRYEVRSVFRSQSFAVSGLTLC
jgi:hypothetical protein